VTPAPSSGDQTDRDQNNAEQERHPPRPVATEVHAAEKDEIGEQQSDWEPGLNDAGELAFVPPGGVLVAHQDGAAPFGAEGEALHDAHEHKHDRRDNAGLSVGGQQPDGESGDAHQDQRPDEDGFATDLVAEVTADDTADRTGGEPDSECCKCGKGACHGALAWKECCAEVQRGRGAEADEIVGFDYCAY
jgi:hypothetical protein